MSTMIMDHTYHMSETPGVPMMDKSKSSPSSTMSSSFDKSSPPVLLFSSGYPAQYGGYYTYPSTNTPGSCGYNQPVTPYSTMEHQMYPNTYAGTPAPVGGHPTPLAPTPVNHLSTHQRPMTAPSYGASTAAPSVLFRQPHSAYGSPSSSISSAFQHDKDLARTPPPLIAGRQYSDPMGPDMHQGYYTGMSQGGLYQPQFNMPGHTHAFGPLKPGGQIKKRSRTAQACEKCRIRKAKCSGGQPCTRCINKKLPCVFSGTARSRGNGRLKSQLGKGSLAQVDAAAQQAAVKGRRHSLDDPFATPTQEPIIRDVRRHSEGNVDPLLASDGSPSSVGALGLDLTPQLSHRSDDLSRPASAAPSNATVPMVGQTQQQQPQQTWSQLPTPLSAPYYYSGSDGFPWTPDTPAVQIQQRYSISEGMDPYTFGNPHVATTTSTMAGEWH